MVGYPPILGFILLVFASLHTGPSYALQININPNTTNEMTASDVNITCTTTTINVTKIVVLEIIKDGGHPIVFLRPDSGISLGSHPPNDVMVGGGIDPVLNQCHLNVTLTNPKHQDSGVYACLLYYLDESGLKRELKNENLSVKAFDSSFLKDLLQRLSLLEKKVSSDAEIIRKLSNQCQDTDAEVKQKLSNHSQEISELKHADAGVVQELSKHSQEISELKTNCSGVLEKVDLKEIDAKFVQLLSNQSQEIRELKQTGAEVFQKLSNQSNKICELKTRNIEIVQRLTNQSEEMNGLKTKVSEVNNKLSSLSQAIDGMKFKVTGLDCDFEVNLCAWTQSNNDGFDWIRLSGLTPTSGTGPVTDHSGIGHYLYIESSNGRIDAKATITSPRVLMPSGQTLCFKMWYFMYGQNVKKLEVFLQYSSTEKQLWSLIGNQGQKWYSVTVDLTNPPVDFNFHITATRGTTYRGDIAIDDVSVTSGPCTVLGTKSVKCDFEKNSCIMAP